MSKAETVLSRDLGNIISSFAAIVAQGLGAQHKCAHTNMLRPRTKSVRLRGVGARNRLPRQHNTRLLAELRRQGRSIRWLCDQMGVSRFAVWRIETGDAGAPHDWYPRAALLLGVRAEDIAPPIEELAA